MTCLSEDEYMARHLGPLKSPVFLPICITYLILFMVDVVGNSLTCVVILLSKVMQTPTNYYLLSLAVSDLLVLLLGMPLELYEMWQNYPFLLREGGCYFKIFLFETVCFASILNVTALSIERYMAVVHPLKVKHRTTHAHVKKVIFRALGAVSVVLLPPNMLYLLIVLQLHREQVLKVVEREVYLAWIFNKNMLLKIRAAGKMCRVTVLTSGCTQSKINMSLCICFHLDYFKMIISSMEMLVKCLIVLLKWCTYLYCQATRAFPLGCLVSAVGDVQLKGRSHSYTSR
uniref:G-protein coupled receptors family 1 profile domain-containing protein n=1 Tax=Mastacembelus armatus TaxID=205130 RepID=A0A7N8XVV5_9TELE